LRAGRAIASLELDTANGHRFPATRLLGNPGHPPWTRFAGRLRARVVGLGEARRIGSMEIADLISPRSVVAQLRVTNKKQALQELAKRASAMTGIHERTIYDVLIERERLGTTGIGTGIGIPHGKLPGLTKLYGIFARLERPIPFEAIDEQPVDLIFLLLAPEIAGADHLKALALVSRLLRDRTVCEKLRGTDNADALYALLTDHTATHAA
jgi:PTS system nitrogen regulatory IIA component